MITLHTHTVHMRQTFDHLRRDCCTPVYCLRCNGKTNCDEFGIRWESHRGGVGWATHAQARKHRVSSGMFASTFAKIRVLRLSRTSRSVGTGNWRVMEHFALGADMRSSMQKQRNAIREGHEDIGLRCQDIPPFFQCSGVT